MRRSSGGLAGGLKKFKKVIKIDQILDLLSGDLYGSVP
jgi:hypothetical protein